MQHLFSCLANLALCSLDMVTSLLQNASAFTSTYTTEDLIIPFSVLFKDGRTHSGFQEIQIKGFFFFFCSTCIDLSSVYLYVNSVRQIPRIYFEGQAIIHHIVRVHFQQAYQEVKCKSKIMKAWFCGFSWTSAIRLV